MWQVVILLRKGGEKTDRSWGLGMLESEPGLEALGTELGLAEMGN